MQISLNRSTFIGLFIAVLSALSALYGAPAGFSGFRIPIWELLLQFNLCTGFVFLVLGALEGTETPIPDLGSSLQLLLAGFVAYGAGCCLRTAPANVQLLLFTTSLALVGAGWARCGIAILRQIDASEK
jgi:hypothetical protein